jgi:hypothetical protein
MGDLLDGWDETAEDSMVMVPYGCCHGRRRRTDVW